MLPPWKKLSMATALSGYCNEFTTLGAGATALALASKQYV